MTSMSATGVYETWAALCDDPRFEGLPFKIETDETGQVLMSPTKNYHGFFASRINRLLEQLLPGGTTGNEIGVITPRGVKVPDSVWVSSERFNRIFKESASSIAPEICVEILSTANTPKKVAEKATLYFECGAQEVWLCDANGMVRFFIVEGETASSRLCPAFPKNIVE